ncbi:MAG: hypothetical protein GY711_23045 [bacterium]|nr:hypothetical protein [bacterium]
MNRPDLASQVYEELRQLAGAQLRLQVACHTLQPTALVNEAWLKLAANPDLRFEDRNAFLALASRAMRQVLIDHARGKRRDKRGAGWQRVTLSALDAPDGEIVVDLPALDDALEELAKLNAERVRLIELRFFGGLTETEAGGRRRITPCGFLLEALADDRLDVAPKRSVDRAELPRFLVGVPSSRPSSVASTLSALPKRRIAGSDAQMSLGVLEWPRSTSSQGPRPDVASVSGRGPS